jgi:hypothetical protein
MGTDLADALISRVNRTQFLITPKSTAAIAVLGCLIAGGFTAAASTAGAARSEQIATVSVNRTNKSDRLPALKFTPNVSSPLVSALLRPPIGCDPAFSRAAEPARAHIFGRCVS